MTTPAREDAHAWPAMWSLAAGFFMLMVDATIVSVSIPSIMAAFGTDITSVIWVSSSYLLTYAVPLLITGRLGDRFGPKNLYLSGLVVFTLASLWCGLAPSIMSLILARGVQGVGASLMAPQTMSIITRLFPPQRRGGPMAVWGATASVASLIGPVLGGFLLDTLGWEWIFFVNIPIGVATFIAVWRLVPTLEKVDHQLDWWGMALNGVAVTCLVLALQEGQSEGWPLWVWALGVVGLLLMGVFVWTQARSTREPLMPLGLFAERNFSLANAAIFLMGACIVAMSFPMMLFLQTVRGLTPTQAALISFPTALVSLAGAPIVGRRLNASTRRRWLIVAGFALFAIGLAWQAWVIQAGISVLWLLAPAVVLGVSSSLIWGPLSVTATHDLPRTQVGAGSGVYNATRQLGSVLGSAAIATVIEWQLVLHLPHGGGAPTRHEGAHQALPSALAQPFSEAMSHAMWLPMILAAVAAGVGYFVVDHEDPRE